MKTKNKINKPVESIEKTLGKTKNFFNNQNYITIGMDFKLLNYYAFNNKNRIIYTSYENMEKFLNKKINNFIILSLVFGLLYLLFYLDLITFTFFIFLLLIHILVIYSFGFFLFNSKNYNYKYFIDKNKSYEDINLYIIFKKEKEYDFSYLDGFIKIKHDKK